MKTIISATLKLAFILLALFILTKEKSVRSVPEREKLKQNRFVDSEFIPANGKGKCSGNLLVHMGQHTLLVPRKEGTHITLKSGSNFDIGKDHADLSCRMDEVDSVIGISRLDMNTYGLEPLEVGLSFGEPSYDWERRGNYDALLEEKIDEVRRIGKSQMLKNGIEILHFGLDRYLLPPPSQPTAYGFPTVITCPDVEEAYSHPPVHSFQTCDTRYYLKEDLRVSYAFALSRLNPMGGIVFDEGVRKRINAMIKDGEAAKVMKAIKQKQ